MKTLLTGNEAAAYAVKYAKPKVVAAYPITPQTTIVETIANFYANKEWDFKFITVESEMSAIAAVFGAALTGVRTFTGTASQGLLFMHEMLTAISGYRLPIVMSVTNRALMPGWNVWADHQDSIAQRDTGWMQIYAETNQEVFDSILQAYRIAEDHDVLLPIMVMEDAFLLSHTVEGVDLPEQKTVDEFLPEYDPIIKVDPSEPYNYGPLVTPDLYVAFRYKMAKAMENAKRVFQKVNEEFKEIFNRDHGVFFDTFHADDADVLLIAAGTLASTTRITIQRMREKGYNVGLARLRVFRPFPTEEVRKLTKNVDVVAVLDRSFTFGAEGAMCSEIKAAMHGHSNAIVKNYITGIGGKDVTPEDIIEIISDAYRVKKEGLDTEIMWIM